MNSYDIAQKLLQGPVADAKRRNDAERAKREAKRAAKAKRQKTRRGSTGFNAQAFYALWRAELLQKFPDLTEESIPSWYVLARGKGEDGEEREQWRGGKEIGQLGRMIDRYDAKTVKQYLVWAIRRWDQLQTQYPKAPKYPTVGWLLVMSASLVGEAVTARPEGSP